MVLVAFGCGWQRNGCWCELDVFGKVSGRYRYIFCLDITIMHARHWWQLHLSDWYKKSWEKYSGYYYFSKDIYNNFNGGLS